MKEKILKLRAEGKTYNEIVNLVKCSKSTVSYHCGKDQKEKVKQRTQRLKSGIIVEKPKKQCLNCKSNLSSNRNKYCNSDCYLEHSFTKTLEKFYKGEVLWNSTIRKILIFLKGEKCTLCPQSNNWNGLPLTLEVDHIDGNSDNCLPKNVRLLCPNCHSQTSTSNGKNIKKNTRRNKYLREYKTAP